MRKFTQTLFLVLLAMITSTAYADNVAKIGTTEYATLQEAINAATSGQTVELMSNVSVSATQNITKGITIDGKGFTVTNTVAAGNSAFVLTGTGDVTFTNIKITATNGHGIQAGNSNYFQGKLTIENNSVLTVTQRGVRVYEVREGFAIDVLNSTIQSTKADPTTTYTTGDHSIALGLWNEWAFTINVNITNSTLQGFSYLINANGPTGNLNVTMTGGKGYGRAILNVWSNNNTFTLNDVEVHGLNNQTGPTEAFACIVDNEGAENNTYNINNCNFIATLSDAALASTTTSASEYLIALRGTNATVNFTGDTDYSSNDVQRGGLIEDEGNLSETTENEINFDSESMENLEDIVEYLDSYQASEPDAQGNYTLTTANYTIKNATTRKKYDTLNAAFAEASSGDVIELLQDYDATGESGYHGNANSRYIGFDKSLTIEGNGNTLTVRGRGIAFGQYASDMLDVTFHNITIENSTSGARCIDTRGNLNSLTLDEVTLKTDGASNYNQTLTIGGNQETPATVKITNSTIQTNDDATAYYAIITFNPVNMDISGSTIKGWACIYAKGPDGSKGSRGSVFNINNYSKLISKNVYNGESNAFCAIMIEDKNVTVNIEDTDIDIINEGNQNQSIGGFQAGNQLENSTINLGEGTDATFEGEGANFTCNNTEGSKLVVSGGIYNQPVPEEICAVTMEPATLDPVTGIYTVASPQDYTILRDNLANENIPTGEEQNVCLADRTLYAGMWNTICLPFGIEGFEGTAFAGAEVREFTGASLDPDTKTLDLKFENTVTAIQPGIPYAIKPAVDVPNPTFEAVDITTTQASYIQGNDALAKFVGTFGKTSIPGGKEYLFITKGNSLVYITDGPFDYPGFRAYFQVTEETAAAAQTLHLSFDEGDTTAINGVETKAETTTEDWYTISGAKLQGKPAQKGIYIMNGKKVVVK